MKVKYDQEVDVLTIELSNAPIEESDEDKPGIILDYDKDGKISKDHGVPKKVGNKIIFPLYHPAAALRNPAVEKILRTEFKKIKEVMIMGLKDFEDKGIKKKDDKQMSLI